MDGPRIMIIGGPGAGKTWLTSKLVNLAQIPSFCVDEAVHDENGNVRPNHLIDQTVCSWGAQDKWIIDGGNTRTYDFRLARATMLVVLKPPRWLRVFRIAWREKMNFSILYWAWNYDRVFGVRDFALLESVKQGTEVYVLSTKAQVGAFVDMFPRT